MVEEIVYGDQCIGEKFIFINFDGNYYYKIRDVMGELLLIIFIDDVLVKL